MSRYEADFMGTTGGFGYPRGADPNYGGGYYGMRMGGGHGRAAYGAYRLGHPRDMEGSSGWGGIHGARPGEMYRGYDRGWERVGGVTNPYRDRRFLEEFNAYSPRYARYDARMDRPAQRWPERPWSPPRDFRPDYANRGMSEGGYSDAWARFPMRGGR